MCIRVFPVCKYRQSINCIDHCITLERICHWWFNEIVDVLKWFFSVPLSSAQMPCRRAFNVRKYLRYSPDECLMQHHILAQASGCDISVTWELAHFSRELNFNLIGWSHVGCLGMWDISELNDLAIPSSNWSFIDSSVDFLETCLSGTFLAEEFYVCSVWCMFRM